MTIPPRAIPRLAGAALVAGLLVAAWPTTSDADPPDSLRLDVTADTTVSAYPGEQDVNLGGAARLKTKGIVELILLDLDPAALRGKVVNAATLHLHPESADIQRRVTVSTLAAPWREGTSGSYHPQHGSASFNWAMQDEQPWAWPASAEEGRSDLIAVINGQGNTIWRFADASAPDASGYQAIAVEPAVIAARVAGISEGFAVTDDVGSEWERRGDRFVWNLFPNRFLASREAGRDRAPYFTVFVSGEDHQGPAAVTTIASRPDDLPAGEAMVSWTTPADQGAAGTVGFFVRVATGDKLDWDTAREVPRYLIPMAAAPGQTVTMHLRDMKLPAGATVSIGVKAVDGAGNVGAAATATITLSAQAPAATITAVGDPIEPFAGEGPLPTVGGVKVAVIDPLDKLNPITGRLIPDHPLAYLLANHLWSAQDRKVRLFAARNEFVGFQVVTSGPTPRLHVAVQLGQAPLTTQVLRFRHVASEAGPLPDPLVPLVEPVQVPAADDGIANQRYASLLVEVYVPHDYPAGVHNGTMRIVSGDQTLDVPIELRVWNFTLPDHLSFVPEMNCYGLPGEDGSTTQRAYYRMAHVHRTCLNLVPYNWRGGVHSGYLVGGHGEQSDWTRFDANYGPLLSGSAFNDLPRKQVPVDVFYLPLNENWPLPVDPAYRGGYWADQALGDEYRRGFVQASRRFAEHVQQRGWGQTIFEFYLNNKVYHKRDGWDHSSALWIFDEPANTQDFWALRWYGTAFNEGVAAALGTNPPRGAKLAFRADISRPHWQRDLLDGVLGVNVVSGLYYQYGRLMNDRRRATGQVTFNYGGSNPIEQSNVQPAAWCIDAWSMGSDGVLPWQTIGNDQSWRRADPQSLFYPGSPGRSGALVPSVRLKSYCRGQQDVEYFVMLGQVLHQPRWAVGRAVRQRLNIRSTTSAKSEDDAGLVSFGDLDPMALWRLRMMVGSILDHAAPPPQAKLVDLQPPTIDPRKLPNLGYVTVAPSR